MNKFNLLAVVLTLLFGSFAKEVAFASQVVCCEAAIQSVDPPRNTPRYSNSQWHQIIRVIEILQIDRDHGHLPKFTSENIGYFVDYASDRDWQRFHTAMSNGNVRRARTIFRDFISAWG